jgi:hypothetical protein
MISRGCWRLRCRGEKRSKASEELWRPLRSWGLGQSVRGRQAARHVVPPQKTVNPVRHAAPLGSPATARYAPKAPSFAAAGVIVIQAKAAAPARMAQNTASMRVSFAVAIHSATRELHAARIPVAGHSARAQAGFAAAMFPAMRANTAAPVRVRVATTVQMPTRCAAAAWPAPPTVAAARRIPVAPPARVYRACLNSGAISGPEPWDSKGANRDTADGRPRIC